MDFTLRCNSLKCRVQLTANAVVTTCSHIFCTPCSNQLGLSNAASGHRVCPACHTALTNPDDAVLTHLNPAEDYKTSVLSGLSPTTIMECAGRGLAFWAYQSTQEIIYQEYLAKSLTDKYSNLNMEMDKIINEANSEIDSLTHKLTEMQVEKDKLKMDKANLATALREKARKHQQTHELYERLKRKEMTAATQHAAFDSVDDVLQSAVGRPRDPVIEYDQRPTFHGRGGSDGSTGRGGIMAPPPRGGHAFENAALRTRGEGAATPSHRHTGLGGPGMIPMPTPGSVHGRSGFGSQRPAQTPVLRRPSTNVSNNAMGRTSGGYGLSAGMRSGGTQKGYSSAGGYL